MLRKDVILLFSLVLCVLLIGIINITYSRNETHANEGKEINGNTTIEESIKYPVNENGQTYGKDNDTGNSPDLIAAIGENGVEGYVKQTDLMELGDANTLDEAIEYDKKRAVLASQGTYIEIPLYKNDGETIIGKFRIYY